MTLADSIRQNRRDVRDHALRAMRSIGATVKKTSRARGAPGPPVATGNLRRMLRLNFDPKRWKMGDTLILEGLAHYSLFHAIPTNRTSSQNPRGFHATIDARARRKFRTWKWRRPQ